jgi:nucleoside-diphosphate-sugar epimerase
MAPKTVLVTGASGYIGNAVARSFAQAGWKTFGLLRNKKHAPALAKEEIIPLEGTPDDLSFLDQTENAIFNVIVSNTEDFNNRQAHFDNISKMVETIAQQSMKHNVRTLVMFTSGCKDYGTMGKAKHGDPGLAPHTEESPLNPPEFLIPRKDFGLRLLQNSNLYDSIVLRPTIVYGHSSSHYGHLFDFASKSDAVLEFIAEPNAIMHSVHVDDCADAYVALAEYPEQDKVINQAFNISNASYETAQEVGEALAKIYGLKFKVTRPTTDVEPRSVHSLMNFSQWVGSDKLRASIEWSEKRRTFIEGLDQYRIAYEAHSNSKL